MTRGLAWDTTLSIERPLIRTLNSKASKFMTGTNGKIPSPPLTMDTASGPVEMPQALARASAGELQHFLHAGSLRRRGAAGRQGHPGLRRQGRDLEGVLGIYRPDPRLGQGSPEHDPDDGGDATLFVHLGYRAVKEGLKVLAGPYGSEEEAILKAQLRKAVKKNPERFLKMAKSIKGVTEETTTGGPAVRRSKRIAFPAINAPPTGTKPS